MTYTSLHNHSYFSVLDGFSSPEEYLKKATELNLKAFAITEHGNAYSWIYFDEIKNKFPKVKMIYGVEAYECFDINEKDKNNKYFHLLLLAKNEEGRKSLNEIITRSNFEGFYYKPRVDINMLKEHADNLIVTTACLSSKISREKDYDKCIEYVQEYKDIFKHFYLEMQSHKHEDQSEYNKKILNLSKDTNTPFIIATDSHVADEDDLKYQSKMVGIARDSETEEEIYEGCYLQSVEEIHVIMDSQVGVKFVDIGLAETNKIADIIEDVGMPFQEPKLPHYPLPDNFKTNEEYLKHLVLNGAEQKAILLNDDRQIYTDRVSYELDIINDMGFAGYFIIVWDFLNWAKENDVIVGAGRGSAGGSLVCYLLGIAELDPIKYDLIFERFLNPERVSMPDIDLDFGDRDKIVEYLTDKYGENNVCQIINYSYITPITAIKDTARVLGIPYKISEKISKRFNRGTFDDVTFDELMEKNNDLLDEYPQYEELFDIASKLSGRLRNVSTHAGGVGIVDTSINDYMPMKLGAKGEHVIQADKKKSEDIGIIKFDILGISTLTMMQEILQDAEIDDWEINPNNAKFLADEKMWNLLQTARTNGVFQVESQGMKELLLNLKPSSLLEVSAILALYRPDSMEMLEDYIHYKGNQEEIELWHDDIGDILEETYGCIIYQEQLMDIVRQFGGRSMGGADKFRKAIGKKDMSLVKAESKKLLDEIINNGYDKEIAEKISSYLETKGGYMFNKSHSALYSVLTLQTAYLKANYTTYFFKALFNQNKNNYGSLNKYIVDSIDFGVKLLPPDINKSDDNFSIHNDEIIFGFDGIKGIGESLSQRIINERNKSKFVSFKKFDERVSPNVSQVVALIKSGAIKCSDKRKYLIGYAKYIFKHRKYKQVVTLPSKKVLEERWQIKFDKTLLKEEKLQRYNEIKKRDFQGTQVKKLEKHLRQFSDKYLIDDGVWEFETLSVFLTANPFEVARRFVSSYKDTHENERCVIIGIISNVTKRVDRHKKQFAFVSLYTHESEIVDITFWHTQYKNYQDTLGKGSKVAVLCRKLEGNRYVVEKMKDYNEWFLQTTN